MANLSGKISEVKMWGRGGNAIRHRSPSCKGKQFARRDANRAERREVKQALASWAEEHADAILMGEDADAHVTAFEAAVGFYCDGCSLCGDVDSYEPLCTCVLCLADDGRISWQSALQIWAQGSSSCEFGLTPKDFGAFRSQLQ